MSDQNEPRKATDVLLDLENKIDILIGLFRAQDMNIKVISNKLNEIMNVSKNLNSKPQFTAETVNVKSQILQQEMPQMPGDSPERNIPIRAGDTIPQISEPQGERRIFRPDKSDEKIIMHMPQAEIQMPDKTQTLSAAKAKEMQPLSSLTNNEIPVIQRCVDKNSKAIFMAEVKVIDLSKGEQVCKTHTNANGKWSATLSPGAYRIMINKGASLNKPAMEAIQEVQVPANVKTHEMPMIIIK